MLKLYGFGPAFGLPDASPYVVKVDAYLRFAKVDYKFLFGLEHLRNAPKKKLPYIDDNGELIGDSEFILEYLKTKGADLDYWLTPEQAAVAHLVTKSLDENLYWCLIQSRWVDDDTWVHLKKQFFENQPFPLKQLLPGIIRKGQLKSIQKQGHGRHSSEEILHIANKTFASMEALLGDKQWFMGDQPSSLDAGAYGHLACFINATLDNPFNEAARQYIGLKDYCERIRLKYY